jgi:hypothetical protein
MALAVEARAALAALVDSLDRCSEMRGRLFARARHRALKRLRPGLDLQWTPAASRASCTVARERLPVDFSARQNVASRHRNRPCGRFRNCLPKAVGGSIRWFSGGISWRASARENA